MAASFSSTPLLQTPSALISRAVEFFHFPSAGSTIEFAKLLWLTRLRWLAIAVFTALIIPGYLLGYLWRDTIGAYIGILSLLFVFNLVSHVTLSSETKLTHRLWICLHLSFDLLALTSLLVLTGGPDSPLVAVFLLNIVLGGFLISGRLGWSFVALSHAFLLLLQLQSLYRYQSSLDAKLIGSFIAAHVLIELFYIVTRSLGAHIERQYFQQSQTRIALERHDRLRAVGALAAGFSHEFSSPLTTAKLRLERLKRSGPSEDVSEALLAVEACEDVVKQMNSAQLDNRDLHYKSILVSDLVQDVVESWSEGHVDRQVVCSLNDTFKQTVPPLNLAQVILNLLDNAHDANPAAPIRVESFVDQGVYVLAVSDEGAGFDARALARLGEPFNTTKPEGTGLGLYISQMFCESLGGSLHILARPGYEPQILSGTRLELRWPLKESNA